MYYVNDTALGRSLPGANVTQFTTLIMIRVIGFFRVVGGGWQFQEFGRDPATFLENKARSTLVIVHSSVIVRRVLAHFGLRHIL